MERVTVDGIEYIYPEGHKLVLSEDGLVAVLPCDLALSGDGEVVEAEDC